jgi:hypothetical protein
MHKGCCYDGSNEYSDDIFENAAIGIQAGDNTAGCCSAETKVDRDIFVNLTQAGISLEDWNALDWYVRYSIFEHNNYGVTNRYGEGGAMHLDHNLFEYNMVDAAWGNGSPQSSYTYNTSYHSGTFLAGGPYGNSSILIGNNILQPLTAAISMPGVGPLTLIDNIVEGSVSAAQGPNYILSFPDGSRSTPGSFVTSMRNTYISAAPFSVQNITYGVNEIKGNLTSLNDQFIAVNNIHGALPVMPGPLPNYNRKIYEVPQGASGSDIQRAINQAIAEDNGNRPIVHLPWGQYAVSSTITIPANSDVQLVGDNMQTIINWTGSNDSPALMLLPPGHATIRNLTVNAASASAGILIEGNDLPGDRIYSNFSAEASPGSLHNLLVNGFDNTLIQMDDFGHGGLTNSSTASVAVVGGPLSKIGTATAGYTGLFMGASANNNMSYRVDNGGTLVVTGFWYEQGGPGWLDLNSGFGNVVGYGDNVSVAPYNRHTAVAANNFTGTLTIANSFIGMASVALGGSATSNVLLLDDNFAVADVSTLSQTSPLVNTNINPNSQAAVIEGGWTMPGGANFTGPDMVSPGTDRNSLIQKALIQLASYKDRAITDLPSENEDVRLIDVIINDGLNSFEFESTAASSSQLRSPANTVAARPVLPSTPTSPWGKKVRQRAPYGVKEPLLM